jgi:hypothetical protein
MSAYGQGHDPSQTAGTGSCRKVDACPLSQHTHRDQRDTHDNDARPDREGRAARVAARVEALGLGAIARVAREAQRDRRQAGVITTAIPSSLRPEEKQTEPQQHQEHAGHDPPPHSDSMAVRLTGIPERRIYG